MARKKRRAGRPEDELELPDFEIPQTLPQAGVRPIAAAAARPGALPEAGDTVQLDARATAEILAAGDTASAEPQPRMEKWIGVPAPAFEDGDRYKVLEPLGSGGMGAVWLAYDRTLKREVALKLLTIDDDVSLERFVAEAQLTGQLEHPGIVPIHDLGRDRKGKFYFAMKCVQGQSMGELLGDRRKCPPLAELLGMLIKVCDAVAFAHAHDVMHRDLKPDNVMVGAFGEVLVMDWGLGRARTGATQGIKGRGGKRGKTRPRSKGLASSGVGATRADMTMDGQVMGTPHFMSPEQAQGANDKVTVRSDVYSLGAMLYTILVGHPPHRGKTVFDVIECAATGKFPPPSKAAPHSVPTELSAIAMKAMSLTPRRRYRDAGALRDDLVRYLNDEEVSAHVDSLPVAVYKWIRRNPVVAAIVLTLAVAGVSGVFLSKAAGKRKIAKQAMEAADQTRTLLAEADGPRALSKVLEALSTADRWRALDPEDPEVGRVRAEVLGKLGDLAIAHRDWTLVGHAVREARELDPAMAKAMRDRAVAARDARRIANGERLKAIFARSREMRLAAGELEAMLFEIVAMQDEQAIPLALAALKGEEPLSRRLGCRVLGWMKATSAFDDLVSALSDPDEEIAVLAAHALGRLGDPRAEPPLTEVYLRRGGATSAFGRRIRHVFAQLGAGVVEGQGSGSGVALEKLVEAMEARHRARDSEGALRIAEEILRRSPGGMTRAGYFARNIKGWALHRLGKFEAAIEVFREMTDYTRDPAGAWYSLAATYGALSRYDQASIAFEKSLAIAPDDPTVRLNYGLMLWKAKRLKSARTQLVEAIRLNDQQPRAHAFLGRVLGELHLVDAAIKQLERARSMHPEDPLIKLQSAWVLRRAARYDEALVLVNQAIEADPQNIGAWYERAELHFARREWDNALGDLERVLKMQANHLSAHELRAHCYHAKGSTAEAIQSITRARELDPMERWDLLELQIMFHRTAGQLDAAEALVARNMTSRHKQRLKIELALIADLRGDKPKALRLLDEALAQDDTLGKGYEVRGRLRAQMGRVAEALVDFDKALANGCRTGRCFANRGVALLQSRRRQEAEQSLKRAVELEPDYEFARYYYAVALAERKKSAEAHAQILKLIEMAPRSRWAARARQLAEKLRERERQK